MAEVLGVVSAVVSLVQLTEELIQYGMDVYNAKEDRDREIGRLKDLRILVGCVKSRLDDAQEDPSTPWNQIVLKLDKARIDHLINELGERSGGDSTKIKIKERFLRPFLKKSLDAKFSAISDTLEDISYVLDAGHYELSKSHMVVSSDTNSRVVNIEHEVRTLSDTLSKQEQARQEKAEEEICKAIQRWLSPLEFLARQKDLVDECFPTGQSFLKSEEFLAWVEGQSWYLQCYGDTGTGKTSLAAITVRHLQENYQTELRPVTCIYLNDKEIQIQTAETLYGSLLKQLLQLSSTPIREELKSPYAKLGKKGARLSQKELGRLFEQELSNYERVYLVVDALNEASEKVRRMVESELSRFCQEQNLSLLITSTDEGRRQTISCDIPDCKTPKMESGLSMYFNCEICNGGFDICRACKMEGKHCLVSSHTLFEPYERVEVEVYATSEEIRNYIDSRINDESPQQATKVQRDRRVHPNRPGRTKLARKLDAAPELRERISTEIIRKSGGKFLLAKLYMDSLVSKFTVEEVKNTLDTFPDSWNTLYCERIEQKILTQEPKPLELAMDVLSLNTCACRALTLVELQHALAIRPGDKSFNRERDFDKEDILAVTKGLLTVNDGIEENSFVRFFHQTLQTYLFEEKDRLLKGAEARMAIACLTCLDYDVFSKPLGQSEAENARLIEINVKKNPFAEYALQFWGVHVYNCPTDSEVEALALRFLQDSDRVALFIQAAWYTLEAGSDSWGARRDVKALHLCAWFGLASLISKMGLDIHAVNTHEKTNGQTPLIYACRRGHNEAAQRLLEIGARMNEPDGDGETALFAAVRAEQEDMVKFLLKNDELDVNHTNSRHRTALMVAIHLDCEAIAEAISQHSNIDPNIRDRKGFTALPLAAEKGYLRTVNSLLERPGIELDLQFGSRQCTALIAVAESGKKSQCEVIRALLQHGANSNLQDNQNGRTALAAAVQKGDIKVIEALFDFKETDPFCIDSSGRGLLHYAAQGGNCDIIRLLKKKGLDVNLKDNNGLTPLHEAARSSQSEVVKLLVEIGGDLNTTDNFGRRPATLAAQNTNADTATLLLGDQNGQEAVTEEVLPIWLLADRGRTDLIVQALERGIKFSDEKDPDTGNGPLHFAALRGHDDILRLLIKQGKMNPDSKGHDGLTPLHLACKYGHMEAFNVLLEYHADMNVLDNLGHPPLFYAMQRKHFNLALALVTAGVNIDPMEVSVQNIFFVAVEKNNVAAVTILIEKGARPMVKNREGLVARQIAKRAGMVEMIRLLDSTRSTVFMEAEGSSGLIKVSMPFRRPEVDSDMNLNPEQNRILEMPSVPTGRLPLLQKRDDTVEVIEHVIAS